MFFNAPATPLDFRFRLFRFPVRVSVWFWLTMALLGESTLAFGVPFLLLWMLCGFAAILVHELGHAVFIRRFGNWCDIELIAFGGLAIPNGVPIERWKRIVISLAGPGFGFGFLGLLVLSDELADWSTTSLPLALAYGFLYMMCLYWNLINLLPIWPLDGGKVCRELCQQSSARQPDVLAFGIGFFTAAGLTLAGLLAMFHSLPPAIADSLPWWMIPGRMMTLFLAMFAVENYMMWQQAKRNHGWDSDDDSPPWQRGRGR